MSGIRTMERTALFSFGWGRVPFAMHRGSGVWLIARGEARPARTSAEALLAIRRVTAEIDAHELIVDSRGTS